jgi:hypothetical protein
MGLPYRTVHYFLFVLSVADHSSERCDEGNFKPGHT